MAHASRLPHTKVTRDDWLRAARERVTDSGVASVSVASLAAELGVSRSSFYWYFSDRADLLDQVLAMWRDHNIAPFVERSATPAVSLTSAVLGVFEIWADPALFDERLEFAVRDWARVDDTVRAELESADEVRVDAIAEIHRRFGQDEPKATVLARVHFLSQIGRYTLGVFEDMDTRVELAPLYLEAFTGERATASELAEFEQRIDALSRRDTS